MGAKQIGALSLLKAIACAKRRWNRKGIYISYNIVKTDPWMIGGVMIFDKRGNLVYAVEETVAQELEMDRITRAVKGARNINTACYNCDGEEENDSDDCECEQTDVETSSHAPSLTGGSDNGR